MLHRIEAGSDQSASELLPLVYTELRHLAAAKLAHEPPGQTLQPTALVHAAWLRLVSADQQTWQNRGHFFAAAAEAMRRILVENARRKRQLKRGGNWQRIDFAELDLPAASPDDKLLLVDEALTELESAAPLAAEVVKLLYYVGLKHAEAAQALNTSERTVRRHWAYAKVWLYQRMRPG